MNTMDRTKEQGLKYHVYIIATLSMNEPRKG